MKRTIFLVLMMIIALGTFTAFAMDNAVVTSDTEMAVAATDEMTPADEEVALLKARVEEIKEMDKSELTREEKRELRKELRDTQKELQARGVYIGAGTLVLLIILILLLR